MLLTLAQSSPNLPQSLRDNAVTVAQQAISQATLELSSSPSINPPAQASSQSQQATSQNTQQSAQNTTPPPPPPPLPPTPAIVAPVILGPINFVRTPEGGTGYEVARVDLNFTTDRAAAAAIYSGGIIGGKCSYPATGINLPTSTEHDFKWETGEPTMICVKLVVTADGLSTTYEHNVSNHDGW
jgi:hypothetical protein